MKDIEKGECLLIKGNSISEAVLCSAARTFALKKVETSNTGITCHTFFILELINYSWQFQIIVYLLPPSSQPTYSVFSRSREYFEVKSKSLTVKQATDLLLPATQKTMNPLSLDALLDEVPLSKAQILQLLPAIGAVVEGEEPRQMVRTFEKEDVIAMVQLLFSEIIKNNWSIEAIPLDRCYQCLASAGFSLTLSRTLEGLSDDRAVMLLGSLVLQMCRSVSHIGEGSISLDPRKVAKIGAAVLMKKHKVRGVLKCLSSSSVSDISVRSWRKKNFSQSGVS